MELERPRPDTVPHIDFSHGGTQSDDHHLEEFEHRKKFTVGFGLVLVLLFIVAFWAISGIGGIVNNAKEVIDGNALNGLLAQREVDHLNWTGKVNALLADETITSLTVETDDHKCGFGQWLYGEQRKAAETMVPSLAPYLKQIEAPHHRLHQSAIAIETTFKPADAHLPALLLEREIDHLNWSSRIKDALLNGLAELDVETNPERCALGRWLQSTEAQKTYGNGNAEFKTAWTEMLEKHKQLHLSAVSLQAEMAVAPNGP